MDNENVTDVPSTVPMGHTNKKESEMSSTADCTPEQPAPAKSSKAPKLDRETFQTSRLLDYCSVKELTRQTGYTPKDWPLIFLKELVDNALDACEEADVPPEIQIVVTTDTVAVADNGPGIPEETIAGFCDYSIRVSSREAYVSPSRGAQGNAMKTILAMPFALHGEKGRVDITSNGRRYEFTSSVDHICQTPVVTYTAHDTGVVSNGTTITAWWPNSAFAILNDAEERFLQLAANFTLLTPHLRMSVDWLGHQYCVEATDTAWKKWRPNDPTSVHWYGAEEFERLLGAYISRDRAHDTDRSVREFVREFCGLSGSAKQKAVLEATGLARVNLSELADADGLKHEQIADLLAKMQEHSKPVPPKALGTIGEVHFRQRFEDRCDMTTFRYKKLADIDDDGIPFVIESAFAELKPASSDPKNGKDASDVTAHQGRWLVLGVNWSPGIDSPFRQLGNDRGTSLDSYIEQQRIGEDEPVVFLMHYTCPRVSYTDSGKTNISID